jgi:hypothetical protein
MILAVHDYRVAAYPAIARAPFAVSSATEGKVHAYIFGAETTVCGFGLGQMRTFGKLFLRQPPSLRCSICDQRVRAASR